MKPIEGVQMTDSLRARSKEEIRTIGNEKRLRSLGYKFCSHCKCAWLGDPDICPACDQKLKCLCHGATRGEHCLDFHVREYEIK
jgi:hypothetical protein